MSEDDYYYDDPGDGTGESNTAVDDSEYDDSEYDESGPRFAWKITSIVIVVLTLLLNLILVGVIVVKRTSGNDLVNKAVLCIGMVDLIYAVFVSPFFVENYIDIHWGQSIGYCHFYEYIFSFHDLFVPLLLIALSAYVSLKYSGAGQTLKFRRQIYMAAFLSILAFSIFLAIPAAVHSTFIQDDTGPTFRKECRATGPGEYSMVLIYFSASALLFCFAMSFFFSLCVVGSPLLRDVYDDPSAYSQRWRLLLSLSLINGLYIVTGFLLNFKVVSRMIFDCCEIKEPYAGTDTLTYDIWSFTMLLSEPMLRPLVTLGFYFKYISKTPKLDKYGRRTYTG